MRILQVREMILYSIRSETLSQLIWQDWWWQEKRLKLPFFWRRFSPSAQKGQPFWRWGTK